MIEFRRILSLWKMNLLTLIYATYVVFSFNRSKKAHPFSAQHQSRQSPDFKRNS